MAILTVPEWMADLQPEDLEFIRKFVLASGSIKELCKVYGVTYPTIRLRLDRVISYINVSAEHEQDPLIAYVKRCAIDDKIDWNIAKDIMNLYKTHTKKEENK